MCYGNPEASAAVKRAECFALATFIFGVLTLIGIVFYPFVGGIGGLLTVIGTSIVICYQGDNPNGHVSCAVLCVLGGLCHAAGAGWLWYTYVEALSAPSDEAVSADLANAVGFWANILIIPTASFQTVAFIFDIISAVLCFKAGKLAAWLEEGVNAMERALQVDLDGDGDVGLIGHANKPPPDP